MSGKLYPRRIKRKRGRGPAQAARPRLTRRPVTSPRPLVFWTKWCAPRQVDREIIYTLRMKFLPTNHTEQVQVFMRPVGSHGPP